MRRPIYIGLLGLVAIINISSCDSGIDTSLLTTPSGVITNAYPEATSNSALYANALKQTHLASSSETLDPALAHTTKKALEAARLAESSGATLASVLIAELELVNQLEESKLNIDDHLAIISMLSDSLQTSGAGEQSIADLKALSSPAAEQIATDLNKYLRTRLLQEILHLWCPILAEIGKIAADAKPLADHSVQQTPINSKARIVADSLASEVDFLHTALSCVEYSPTLLAAYLYSVENASAIAAQAAPLASIATAWDNLRSILASLLARQGAQLKILSEAANQLNSVDSPFLKDVLAPLPFGASDYLSPPPTEQLSKLIEQGKKVITFTAPGDHSLDIYAAFFALQGKDTYLVDLFSLAQSAHALQISDHQFIDWASQVINSLKSNTSFAPIVILKNLSTLNYDYAINEGSSKNTAMARNFDDLVGKIKDITLLAPIPPENRSLFLNSKQASLARVYLTPLQLMAANKINSQIAAMKNQQQSPSLSPTSFSSTPLKLMSRIYRAFKPDQFSIGTVLTMNEQFWQQRALSPTTLSKEQEQALALKIASESLDIDQKIILESQVLNLDASAIENQLAQNLNAFNNALSRKELLEARSRMDLALSRIRSVYAKTREERDKTEALLSDAQDLLKSSSTLAEFKTDLDNKITNATTTANSALEKADQALNGLTTKADKSEIKDIAKTPDPRVIATIDDVTIKPEDLQDYAKLSDLNAYLEKAEADRKYALQSSLEDAIKKAKDARDALSALGVPLDPKAFQDALEKATAAQKAFKDLGLTPDPKPFQDALDKATAAQKAFKDLGLAPDPKPFQDALDKATAAQKAFKDLGLAPDPKDFQDALDKATAAKAAFDKIIINPAALLASLKKAQNAEAEFRQLEIDPTALNNKLKAAQKAVDDFQKLSVATLTNLKNDISALLAKLGTDTNAAKAFQDALTALTNKINDAFDGKGLPPKAFKDLQDRLAKNNAEITKITADIAKINKEIDEPLDDDDPLKGGLKVRLQNEETALKNTTLNFILLAREIIRTTFPQPGSTWWGLIASENEAHKNKRKYLKDIYTKALNQAIKTGAIDMKDIEPLYSDGI